MEMAKIGCDEGDGDPKACHGAASFISAVKQDRKAAAEIYMKNCDTKNYPPSCFHIGRHFLLGGGVDQNDQSARHYFEKACNDNHVQGCNHLGMLLLQGSTGPNGVAKDPKKAEKILQFACEKGAVESCYYLGTEYIKARGLLKRSPMKAKMLFEYGCDNGNGPSCYNLAVMYKNGDDGIPINEEKFETYAEKTKQVMNMQRSAF